MVMPASMEDFLNRKYAILQQQADATTANSAATTRNAATAALTGAADARLNTVRADLLPKESAASIAKMGAETGYINTQNKWFGPSAQADIAFKNANTDQTLTSTKILRRGSLTPLTSVFGTTIDTNDYPAMSSIFSRGMPIYGQ